MKHFLKKWLIFVLVVFIVAIPLDIFISYRLRHDDTRVFKAWNDIYNQSLSNNLVINGSSRAWGQYNPEILDSVLNIDSYNLGIDGSAVNRQILKYKTYCRLHGHPKYLIQNVDMKFFGLSYGYEREQFFPYFFSDRKMMMEYDEFEHFSWAEKYLPCYRYVGYSDLNKSAIGFCNFGKAIC